MLAPEAILRPVRVVRHTKAETVKITTGIRPTRYLFHKQLCDRALAFLLLIPAMPLIAIMILLVRATSSGPGIFSQVRVGLNGELFRIYKIRTMRSDAESRCGAVWATNNDSRVTPLGRILRKSHLDELPQLINVVRGEMSLVGPRPERPEFVDVLARRIPRYCDRLLVRPGITGLAQVILPPDCDLNSVRRKLEYDREYIRAATLWTDVRLMVYTAGRLFKIPEKPLLRLVGLRRTCPANPISANRNQPLPPDAAAATAAISPPKIG